MYETTFSDLIKVRSSVPMKCLPNLDVDIIYFPGEEDVKVLVTA